MNIIKPFLLLFIISFASNSFGQLWNRYADSAAVYMNQRNVEKAITYYETAIKTLTKDSGNNNRTIIMLKRELGNVVMQSNNFEKANKIFLENKATAQKISGNSSSLFALTCFDLAFLYLRMSDYESSEPLLIQSKRIIEKNSGKADKLYSSIINNLANLYNDIGKYKDAELLALERYHLEETISGKRSIEYAQACNNLGNLYITLGQYNKAELFLLEARQIKALLTGENHPDYANTLFNLGRLYTEMGLYKKGEQNFVQARDILTKSVGKQNMMYAQVCNGLAAIYLNTSQDSLAENLFIEVRNIVDKTIGRNNPQYINTSNNLAALYYLKNDYAKAENIYLELTKSIENSLGVNSPEYAIINHNLAVLHRDQAKYNEAQDLTQKVKVILEKLYGKTNPLYKRSAELLASIYWLTNDIKQAHQLYQEVIRLDNNILKNVFSFTNEEDKSSYIKEMDATQDAFQSFYSTHPLNVPISSVFDFSLFNRNLILSSSQQVRNNIYNSNDTSIKSKYDDWIALKQQLAFWYSKPKEDRIENIDKLEDQANNLEKYLTRLSSTFKNQQRKRDISWKIIHQTLKPDEAAIEFVQFTFFNGKKYTDSVLYAALMLRKDMLLPVMIQLFNEEQLTGLLSSTGNKTTNDGVKELYGSRGVGVDTNIIIDKSIYELVWKPLEKELKGIKTIYFAPAGILHRVAFAALPVNKTEVLIDRYKLVQLATTASVTDQTPTFITSSDQLQLYGGIKYDVDSTELKKTIQLHAISAKNEKTRSLPDDLTPSGSFSYLPGTEAEIGIIEKQAKQNHVSALSGIKATEESFKALNDKASPSVIHIATHGFFFADPKQEIKKDIQLEFESGKVFKQSDNPLFRSGLAFAGANHAWQGKPIEGIDDGILTAYEVSNIYLPKTKLVVLSACETALGDIQGSEGVYGLQRSFKMAGVQNLVMSLWKVPDAETSEFMQQFYKNMFAKQSVSDAFYHAQATMKNKYRNDPYKWAAWVLVR